MLKYGEDRTTAPRANCFVMCRFSLDSLYMEVVKTFTGMSRKCIWLIRKRYLDVKEVDEFGY